MDIFANELSIHDQFHDIPSFHSALKRLMVLRNSARRLGRDVYCRKSLLHAKAVSGMPIQQVLNHLSNNESRAMMHWITRGGPHWEDLRQHSGDDYMECPGEVMVTDSAVGEAAYKKLSNVECGLISVTPSDWDYSPIEVTWRREAEGLEDKSTILENWWEVKSLESSLHDAAPPIQSWDELQNISTERFKSLTFSGSCFKHLKGVPLAKSSADRFLFLLNILEQYACAFDESGERTHEGSQIDRDYFTGERAGALFSDSTQTEKRDFRKELTFPHPDHPGETLFCPWHGKVSHQTLRLHFSWPIRSGKPVYIVYAGPKITKK